jgi:hypothetical protein
MEKKRNSNNYFGKKEEAALKQFLLSDDEKEKNKLFKEIIDPAIRKLVEGVMQMPMFQKIVGISKEDLAEDTYHHVLDGVKKFNPESIGKNGKPAKAYSYLGTAAKNYILYIKIQLDKKMATTGIDLNVDDFSNIIEDKTKGEVIFKEKQEEIIGKLKQFVLSNNSSKNDVLVCHCLIYMLSNWNSLEFSTKNEFNRLLLNYTGLKNNTVTLSFKKIKTFLSLSKNE